jgi:hypothetical protein
MSPTTKQLRDAIIVTVVPLTIALLIQRPDLRQALIMRAALMGKRIAQSQADFWQSLATEAAQAYNKARL